MNAIVSEKGQVTIPKAVREAMGIVPGVKLSFIEEGGTLTVRKVLEQDPVSKWRGRGKLPEGECVDDYLRKIRDAG